MKEIRFRGGLGQLSSPCQPISRRFQITQESRARLFLATITHRRRGRGSATTRVPKGHPTTAPRHRLKRRHTVRDDVGRTGPAGGSRSRWRSQSTTPSISATAATTRRARGETAQASDGQRPVVAVDRVRGLARRRPRRPSPMIRAAARHGRDSSGSCGTSRCTAHAATPTAATGRRARSAPADRRRPRAEHHRRYRAAVAQRERGRPGPVVRLAQPPRAAGRCGGRARPATTARSAAASPRRAGAGRGRRPRRRACRSSNPAPTAARRTSSAALGT